MSGDGLIRGIGAPPGGNLPIGVQPGVNPAIVIANKVIVFGPGGGVFVYSGTPAHGNPPIAWMSSGTTDPYGNTLPSTTGVAASGTFQAGDTIITTAGIFVYSGTPALGNLIVSIASAAGSDSFGNAYPQGLKVTTGTISGTTISASTFSGTDFIINATGTFYYSGTPAAGNLVMSDVPGTVQVTDPFGNVAFNGKTMYRFLLGTTWFAYVYQYNSIQAWTASTQAGPYTATNNALIFQPLANTQVLSTAAAYATLNDNLLVNAGTGATLSNNPIIAATGGVGEVWHSMSLLNSWANNGSFTASRYRLMPDNSVRVQGVINATAATAATFFTLPAGYHPANTGGAPVGCNAGAGANTVPTLRWDTSGNLTINNLTIPSASAVFFTQDIPLD